MPTVITNTIGATGREYSTIASWEAASPVIGSGATGQGLVAADEQWTGELYNDASPSFAETITCSGATTDATRFRCLRAAASHVYDHVTDTGVVIRPANEFGSQNAAEANFRFGWPGRGFCLKGKSAADLRAGGLFNAGIAGGWVVDSITVRKAGGTGGVVISTDFAGTGTIIRNCLCIDCDGRAVNADRNVKVLNCTAIACRAFERGTTRTPGPVIKNCVSLSPVSGNCFTEPLAAWGAGSDFNLATDTSPPGASSVQSATASDVVEDTTGGSQDLHLKSGSAAIDAGTTDTDAGTDHENVSRPIGSAYDMGAFEFAAGGVVSSPGIIGGGVGSGAFVIGA